MIKRKTASCIRMAAFLAVCLPALPVPAGEAVKAVPVGNVGEVRGWVEIRPAGDGRSTATTYVMIPQRVIDRAMAAAPGALPEMPLLTSVRGGRADASTSVATGISGAGAGEIPACGATEISVSGASRLIRNVRDAVRAMKRAPAKSPPAEDRPDRAQMGAEPSLDHGTERPVEAADAGPGIREERVAGR